MHNDIKNASFTYLVLLSLNLIGLSPGRTERYSAQWIQLLNKTENVRLEILCKNSESNKTWENTLGKTRKRFLMSFQTIFGKFESQLKTLGKSFWTYFMGNSLSKIAHAVP